MEDISWPSSPIGTVSCTAFVLCHRTGRAEEVEDISWPSSPIGVVSCIAFVLSHRTSAVLEEAEEQEEEEEEERSWQRKILQPPH